MPSHSLHFLQLSAPLSSVKPIAHYTLLLLLFGVGAYKGISLSLLSATLVGELSYVPCLVGKLQRIAGALP